jgi:hypothetical protein
VGLRFKQDWRKDEGNIKKKKGEIGGEKGWRKDIGGNG